MPCFAFYEVKTVPTLFMSTNLVIIDKLVPEKIKLLEMKYIHIFQIKNLNSFYASVQATFCKDFIPASFPNSNAKNLFLT